MSINYPSSLDSFANPSSTDLMENASPALDHDVQHANANDAIEALEAKVGVDSSAVTTSFDYKLSEVISTDKAVGKTATQTITNKTLGSGTKVTIGSDADGDMYYRESDGSLTRIPIGTSTYILTSDGSTPSWQANAAGSDASTTVKGVVEEATAAELAAGTAAGGTGARLFTNPSTLMPSGKINRNYLAASFGGTGSDGALTISSGTTTIDLGGAAVFSKNYTSISITGTGSLAFSNPASAGTIIIFKSQGDVTITSSSSSVIDLRSLGSTAGAAGSLGTSGVGSGGAGGASLFNNGSTGQTATVTGGATAGGTGTTGTGLYCAVTGGAGGKVDGSSANPTATITSITYPTNSGIFAKRIPLAVGTGGGGAGGTNSSGSSTVGAGGRGAGCLYVECAGALNFTTGTILATGADGSNGAGSFGTGGGGGGGGTVIMLYNSLTANSGTITTTGGSGGSGSGNAGGAGGNGGSLVALNTEFV